MWSVCAVAAQHRLPQVLVTLLLLAHGQSICAPAAYLRESILALSSMPKVRALFGSEAAIAFELFHSTWMHALNAAQVRDGQMECDLIVSEDCGWAAGCSGAIRKG